MRATQFITTHRVAFNPFAIVPQIAFDDELNIAESKIAEEIRITGRCRVLDGPPADWGNPRPSRIIDRWRDECAAAKYQREFEKEHQSRKAEAQHKADLEWEEAGRKSAETQAALAQLRRQREEQESAVRFAALQADAERRKQDAAAAKAELIKEVNSWGVHFGADYDPSRVEWRLHCNGIEARFGGKAIFICRDLTSLISRIRSA